MWTTIGKVQEMEDYTLRIVKNSMFAILSHAFLILPQGQFLCFAETLAFLDLRGLVFG